MSNTSGIANRGSEILNALIQHWKVIAIATGVCTFAAAFFAFSSRSWQASQSLIVRDDLAGEAFKPGRFDSLDALKTEQETIYHIAREPAVVRNVLEKVGPPPGGRDNWLDGDNGLEAIEDLQGAISIVAPNGAEFGRTEVIVLRVKGKPRERVSQLVTAIIDEVEVRLRQLRSNRLGSMQAELEQALTVAEKENTKFGNRLEELENSIGPDLPTLRAMISDLSSSNDLQVALENVRIAKRSAQAKLDLTSKQLNVLESTSQNPEALVATPNELLEAQPALKRLKDGLVDVQLTLSRDLGRFHEAHPIIAKHRIAIDETKGQIREELTGAIDGLNAQLSIHKKQLERLESEELDFTTRLAHLTNNRVKYANLISQSKKRNEELADAQAQFDEIKSLKNAAKTIDLITRIDEPFVSSRPLGPGKTALMGSGLIGGLLLGTGIVIFFSGPGGLMIPPSLNPNPTNPLPASTSNVVSNQASPNSNQSHGRTITGHRNVTPVQQLNNEFAGQKPAVTVGANPQPATAAKLPTAQNVPRTNPGYQTTPTVVSPSLPSVEVTTNLDQVSRDLAQANVAPSPVTATPTISNVQMSIKKREDQTETSSSQPNVDTSAETPTVENKKSPAITERHPVATIQISDVLNKLEQTSQQLTQDAVPQEEPGKIELSAIREELGFSTAPEPIGQGNATSATPTPEQAQSDYEELQERIKKLTDPTKTVRHPLAPELPSGADTPNSPTN